MTDVNDCARELSLHGSGAPDPGEEPMDGCVIHVADPQRGRHALRVGARVGTLMELLRDEGMSLMALCGGGMACGTCHVHLHHPRPTGLAPASEDEVALLESCEMYAPEVSRLSCQVRLDALSGAVRLSVIGE